MSTPKRARSTPSPPLRTEDRARQGVTRREQPAGPAPHPARATRPPRSPASPSSTPQSGTIPAPPAFRHILRHGLGQRREDRHGSPVAAFVSDTASITRSHAEASQRSGGGNPHHNAHGQVALHHRGEGPRDCGPVAPDEGVVVQRIGQRDVPAKRLAQAACCAWSKGGNETSMPTAVSDIKPASPPEQDIDAIRWRPAARRHAGASASPASRSACSTRAMPSRSSSARAPASLPASAPVCDRAAVRACSDAPALITTILLPSARARPAIASNARTSPIPSICRPSAVTRHLPAAFRPPRHDVWAWLPTVMT
jgi:hypothetical protein